MTEQITQIADFIVKAFIHIWPYLLITIPISVAVNMSGASKHINKAFKSRPALSILLATIIGAFSPFCSCGVIPVIAALLIGGVPLAPVMSFWIASPSMDPEMFMLSAATLGWDLAVWRLASTLLLSLSAGFITHYLWKKGWLGDTYVKIGAKAKKASWKNVTGGVYSYGKKLFIPLFGMQIKAAPELAGDSAMALSSAPVSNEPCGCGTGTVITRGKLGCCDDVKPEPSSAQTSCGCGEKKESFYSRLLKEASKASIMVIKFMLLAFFLEAIIILYVPESLITGMMGKSNSLSILWGALIGVPVYTSNLTALPMVGALLQHGMNPGAALAFLISGPITTIPAMVAVKGLTTKKVFYLYVSFAFFGALVFGYLYYFAHLIF